MRYNNNIEIQIYEAKRNLWYLVILLYNEITDKY